MKVCTKCNSDKELSEYYKDKSKKDGLSSSCKSCKNKQNIEYQATNKESKAEYDKNRRTVNRETINKKKRDYYHSTGKYVEKIWRAANWDKVLTYAKNSKAKRRALERSYKLPSTELITWVDNEPKVCKYCGCDCSTKYHIDHVVPLARGGAHAIHNLVIACPFCNISKGKKLLSEWTNTKLIEIEDKKPL